MKKQTLSLLTVTILAIGIATLFTACEKPEVEPKPEPQKSGGGGGVTSKPEPDEGADDKTGKPADTTTPVTGKAAKGTGTDPSISVVGGDTDAGQVKITLIDPEHWGTRDNGTPVAKTDLSFWLFYQEGTKAKATIIAAIANAVVHTATLAAPNTTKGVIQIAPPDTTRAASPFRITGLKQATKYSFFLRLIHPDAPAAATPTKPNADERTKYARDTAVAHGTSTGWYVSTIATGFNAPNEIAVATDGNTLYVADTGNHSIKQITKAGVVSIIAGDGTAGYNGDKTTGTDAQFNNPYGIAIAPDDNALYVADIYNHRIRKIALSGDYTVSTIAGDGTASYKDDATGTDAQFNNPAGIAIAPDGTALYVADMVNHRIRRIALSGDYTVSTIAANIGRTFPQSIAATKDALYVVGIKPGVIDGRRIIRRIALTDNAVSIFARGYGQKAGMVFAPDGTLYVAVTYDNVIKKLTLNDDGTLKATTIIAGSSTAGTTNGIGTTAQFNQPVGIAVQDKDGNTLLYVADTVNNSIRKLELKE